MNKNNCPSNQYHAKQNLSASPASDQPLLPSVHTGSHSFTLVHNKKSFQKTFSLAEIAKRHKIPTMIRTIQLLLLFVWLLPNVSSAELSDAKLKRKADFWTFKKAERPAIPANNAANPIDAFIRDRWQRENLHGSPSADRRTLARRV